MIKCTFENGKVTSLRHLCVNAILLKNKKVLLGKRGTFKGKKILESGKWGLIGGFFDRDEYMEEGLKREVMEESGWEIDNIKLFRINDKPNRPAEDRQNVDVIFIANAVKKTGGSDEEVKKLKWFSLDKLPPKENVAFDHWENLDLFIKYSKSRFNLPIWGKYK